jgi:GNAT superfamily N-acetyltransferase
VRRSGRIRLGKAENFTVMSADNIYNLVNYSSGVRIIGSETAARCDLPGMKNEGAIDNKPASESQRVCVRLADPSSPESLQLFQHLWEELGRLYGHTGPCEFVPADVEGAGDAFVIARLDKQPVGCGAIRPLEPGVAEIKRMFIEPAARRRGIGQRILLELEKVAGVLGYVTVRLETGLRQPEAIRLYERAGYKRIECYGMYAEDPLSICMEKRLN